MSALNGNERPVLSKRFIGILAALCAVNVAAHALLLPALPDSIPSHWNAQGMVDGTVPKLADLALSFLPVGVLALFMVIPKIEPRQESYQRMARFYRGFVLIFTLFMIAITWCGILTAAGILSEGVAVNGLVFAACGLLFIYIGNYMPRVRQNYTMGVKTPWTLASKTVWEKTQRAGGRAFVVLGILSIILAALGFVAPEEALEAGVVVFLAAVIGVAVWCMLYSWLLWKKEGRKA